MRQRADSAPQTHNINYSKFIAELLFKLINLRNFYTNYKEVIDVKGDIDSLIYRHKYIVVRSYSHKAQLGEEALNSYVLDTRRLLQPIESFL